MTAPHDAHTPCAPPPDDIPTHGRYTQQPQVSTQTSSPHKHRKGLTCSCGYAQMCASRSRATNPSCDDIHIQNPASAAPNNHIPTSVYPQLTSTAKDKALRPKTRKRTSRACTRQNFLEVVMDDPAPGRRENMGVHTPTLQDEGPWKSGGVRPRMGEKQDECAGGMCGR
ncbi:hypothetical protein B0H10DRAFT_2238858 [Mycena sp. CBHHK59/15]|nr:hypothetical protein B0H10DRAFT_2238858 [Mycena sp. CBHHK59/15]